MRVGMYPRLPPAAITARSLRHEHVRYGCAGHCLLRGLLPAPVLSLAWVPKDWPSHACKDCCQPRARIGQWRFLASARLRCSCLDRWDFLRCAPGDSGWNGWRFRRRLRQPRNSARPMMATAPPRPATRNARSLPRCAMPVRVVRHDCRRDPSQPHAQFNAQASPRLREPDVRRRPLTEDGVDGSFELDVLPDLSLTLAAQRAERAGIPTALQRGIEPRCSRFSGFLLLTASAVHLAGDPGDLAVRRKRAPRPALRP